MFNWTIPDTPHEHCAVRIRYNISTEDYDPWRTNHSSNIGKIFMHSYNSALDNKCFSKRKNIGVQIIRFVSACLCVWVCVHACACLCVGASVCMCMFMCVHPHVFMCAHVCMHVRVCVWVPVCTCAC